MIVQYRAFVQVITPDYKYWNRLADARDTYAAAQADVDDYLRHKREGTGGFRKGAPGRTEIKPVMLPAGAS